LFNYNNEIGSSLNNNRTFPTEKKSTNFVNMYCFTHIEPRCFYYDIYCEQFLIS